MPEQARHLTIIRTVFGGEQQSEQIQLAGAFFMPFEEALIMVTHRYATKDDDYIYMSTDINDPQGMFWMAD